MQGHSPVLSREIGWVHPANEISDKEEGVGDGQRHQVVSCSGASKTVWQTADGQTERVAQQARRYDGTHAVEIAVADGWSDPRYPRQFARWRHVAATAAWRHRIGCQIHCDTATVPSAPEEYRSCLGLSNLEEYRQRAATHSWTWQTITENENSAARHGL